MKQITTEGIVLSRTDYGEADRIITFLTPDNGKVRAMAKGVRKPKSKLAGGIELFSVSDITYIEGKGDLHTLVSTRLKSHFGDIVTDIDRTMYGYDVLKLLGRVLEDEGGEEYYELLLETLKALNTLAAPKELAEAFFSLHLMRYLGHLPHFTHDLSGNPLEKDKQFQFSFDDMAFFEGQNGQFTQNHIKLLRLLAHNAPEQVSKVTNITNYLKDLIPLIRQMLRQYVVPF